MTGPRGWYSREYLPHFDAGDIPQSVCFHLIDSIPQAVRDGWMEALQFLPKDEQLQQRRRLAESYLDRGEGPAWLSNPIIAELVQNAFLFFDGQRYTLHAWVIMPNHAHVLFTPHAEESMLKILSSWKSYTSLRANPHLERTGHFWYPDFYDRYIRNETHYQNVVRYIEMNPVKAGLCERPQDWPWSSASYRQQSPTP